MTFKKGFTLAEVLITLVIIGIMATCILVNFQPRHFDVEAQKVNAYKVLSVFGLATEQIFELDKEQCPYAKFIIKPAGATEYEFAVTNKKGSEAAAVDIMELYSKHIKFESSGFPFCNYTPYCNNASIIGGKIVGDVYIGIEKLKDIQDCSPYRMPQETVERPAPVILDTDTGLEVVKKCWGKLYVDVNGKEAPNEYGRDVFVFGLGEDGIAN